MHRAAHVHLQPRVTHTRSTPRRLRRARPPLSGAATLGRAVWCPILPLPHISRHATQPGGVGGGDEGEGLADDLEEGVDRAGEGPPGYTDTAATIEADSIAMYNKWHGKGRALYAVTPRATRLA